MALQFTDIIDKIDPNNLDFIFSSSENIPKDFGNCQIPLKLFKDVRDVNINPKEELKNQASFNSDLSEIKIGRKKSINQKNKIQNINNFFYLKEEIIHFSRNYSFLLSELSLEQNMEKDLKY